MSSLMNFEQWWAETGSLIPQKIGETLEDREQGICRIAWKAAQAAQSGNGDADFDVLEKAFEEVRFAAQLGVIGVEWEFGVNAWGKVLEGFKPDFFITRDLNEVQDAISYPELFLGLPVKVRADVNPWRIKLITKT